MLPNSKQILGPRKDKNHLIVKDIICLVSGIK